MSEGQGDRQDPAQARPDAAYRSLFDDHPDGLYRLDIEGRLVDANAALEAMTGYACDELRRGSLLSVIHPDDRERLLSLPRGEAVSEHEVLGVRRDGRPFEMHVTHLPIHVDGELVGFHGIVRDIGARRRTDEASVERSRSLLRIAGSLGRIGGWSYDAATEEVHWSEEMYRILGFPPGRPPELGTALLVHPPEHRERIRALAAACMASGTRFDTEAPARRSDGVDLWIRIVGEPVHDRDGRIVGIRGAVQDIGPQKRAHAQLEDLAAQLATTLESITDAFYTLDRDWRFVYVNQQAEELLRRDRLSLLGRDVWEEFPAIVGTELEESYRRAAADGETRTLEAFRYGPLDAWFEVNAYPSAQGLAVYFREISERVEREDRLREIADVEQRAADRLRAVDRVKTAFLTAVSHELRTPLTVVHGMAATLQRLRGVLAADARDRLEDSLVHHTERLRQLLDELLDVDRLSRGAITADLQQVDAVTIVTQVAASSRVRHRIRLDTPDVLLVNADPVQIERTVANLLDNVAKYAPSGPVEVQLSARAGGGLRLEVVDVGPGIPDDELEQVFEPFHRVDEAHPQPGTGVGLALVAQFAELHGGRAWAEPTEGVGAHVIVELPDAQAS